MFSINLLLQSFRLILFMLCMTFLPGLTCAADKEYIKTQIQHWQTTAGVPVYFVQSKELPMIDIAIAFDAGSARDGNQFGIARFTANMLNTGTKKLTAEELAEQIDELGMLFNTNVDREMTTIRLRSLTKADILSKAVTLFNQILTAATFPTTDFNRTKKITLNALKAQQQSPEKVGQLNLYQNIYQDFPYAHPILGTNSSIDQLTIAHLKSFYKKYYVAKNATLAIVGDVTLEQAKKIAEDIIKNLPLGQKAEKLSSPKPTSNKELQIEFPSDQSTIFIGCLGTNRHDPDYVPLYLGNYILGGGLTSRLFESVRIKKGFSYNIYSHLDLLRYNGAFFIYLLTKSTQSKEAIALTKQTLENFLNEGPTQTEIDNAKKFVTGNIPLNFASNDEILNYLLLIGFYELPSNYLNQFINKINALDTKNIKRAFNQHIQLKNMIQIIVGKETP